MKAIALAILRFYKQWISPSLLPSCRYVPTCSEYATEAIERFGVLRGGAMAVWRLLRCHPFVKGGYDPVVKITDWSRPQGDFENVGGSSCCGTRLTTND